MAREHGQAKPAKTESRASRTSIRRPEVLPQQRLDLPPVLTMPDQLLEMHTRVGNRAVSAFLDGAYPTMQRRTIQRVPDPPAVWNMPFGMGQTSDREQAIIGLVGIVGRLETLERLMAGQEGQSIDPEVQQALDDFSEEALGYGRQFAEGGALTEADARNLNWFGQDVQEFHDRHIAQVRRRLEQAVQPLVSTRQMDTSQVESELAEELHYAFIEGSPDRIEAVQDALDKIKEYNERVQQVADWGSRISGQIRMARTADVLSRIAQGTEHVGEVLGRVSQVITAARALSTMAGIGDQAAGDMQNSLDQFEQALAVVDIAMSFADAVPVLGTLWSQYYYPVAQNCIRLLRVIARATDRQVRDFAQFEWGESRREGLAPRIPRGADRFFPGGQSVLDFMYAVMTGGSPDVTPAVEGFFLQHLELFNAGRGRGAELEATGSRWYNPLSWLEEDHIPNLADWVQSHRSHVWAMLYGDIPVPP